MNSRCRRAASFTTRMWRQVELWRGRHLRSQHSRRIWTRRAERRLLAVADYAAGLRSDHRGDRRRRQLGVRRGAPGIVGYAITRQDQIVELLTDPAAPGGRGRVGGPCLRRGDRAPVTTTRCASTRHRIDRFATGARLRGCAARASGGGGRSDDDGGARSGRAGDADLIPSCRCVAKTSRARPIHWRVDLDGGPHRFTLSQRSVRFSMGGPSRCDIDCTTVRVGAIAAVADFAGRGFGVGRLHAHQGAAKDHSCAVPAFVAMRGARRSVGIKLRRRLSCAARMLTRITV